VPVRPDIVGAASHPPRRSPDQAAPNFTALLRQDSGEGLSPPLDYMAPRGALRLPLTQESRKTRPLKCPQGEP
jgi:hypothetical protein